ncbi:MAG TPA: aminotransferase class I/II-fold pyridoxal phosphate-dependent enzyme [candidate division Zixibacteria bacterium]|nr:aminotransferase class I/II-fold pyridoxal phosphate-dependent enzyme [candidate division Zixibacteria bacterium]
MIKKVVLDKADRLYHFPFDLEEFYPKRTLKTGERKIPVIDLGHFNWPVKGEPAQGGNCLETADANDFQHLKILLAEWLKKEFGIKIDPRKEIYIGQGIHRIVFDICLAYVEYGDIVLCPEPGMPFYRRMAISVGGVPVTYPITARTNYKPSFVRLLSNQGKAAKIIILNNPNNPFGTMLDETDLAELIGIASKQNLYVVNDAAYCTLAEEKYIPLQAIPGGDKVGLEIFSFPYIFGMPYIPFGFAVGTPDVISGLINIRKTVGLTVPKAWIEAAAAAIESYPSPDVKAVRKLITQSRLEAGRLVEKMEWRQISDRSCPFMWAKIPDRKHSVTYASALLRRWKILTLPGTAFGEIGDGYIRLSLTAGPDKYKEAIQRSSKKLTIRTRSGE